METVTLPEFEGDSPKQILINLYVKLGWDRIKKVYPSKIKINEDDWIRLCTFIFSRVKNKDDSDAVVGAGLFLVDFGPSGGNNTLQKGDVILEDGWQKEEIISIEP